MTRYRVTYKNVASDGTKSHVLPEGTRLDQNKGELLIPLLQKGKNVFQVDQIDSIIRVPEGKGGKYHSYFFTSTGSQVEIEKGERSLKPRPFLAATLILLAMDLGSSILQGPSFKAADATIIKVRNRTHTLTRPRRTKLLNLNKRHHHDSSHRPSFTYPVFPKPSLDGLG